MGLHFHYTLVPSSQPVSSWLGMAGDIASLLSLVASGWVLWKVWSLNSLYQRHILMPSLVRALTLHAKNARRAAQDKRVEGASSGLHKADVVLDRISKHGDWPLKRRAKSAKRSIAVWMKQKAAASAESVIDEIEAVIEDAKHFASEDRWALKA